MMKPSSIEEAGGRCQECGLSEKDTRMTIQRALPVVINYLEMVSVSESLSDDVGLGMAMEDLLSEAIKRLNRYVNRPLL